MGHIINLSVQAFLFGDDKDDINPGDNLVELEAGIWRTKGALGKLHNIVVFVDRSPQRISEFQEYSGGIKLHRDNATRWNSWSQMIRIALKPKARYAIYMFTEEHRAELVKDSLSVDNWNHIEGVYKVLAILEQTTLDVEGALGTLGKVMIVMDFLLDFFEKIRLDQTDRYTEAVKGMSNNAWNKLTKYYNLTDTSIAYIAAVVLDPGVKWVYFTHHWLQEWIKKAKEDMLEHWHHYQAPRVSKEPYMHQRVHTDGQSEISKFRAQFIP